MTSTMSIEYGNQVWRNQDGKFHRLDGQAFIGCDGSKGWFINGERHRIVGPAIIHPDGYQAWWVEGKWHHLDGPAVIGSDGSQHWFVRGNDITVQVEEWLKQNNRSYPFDLNTQILFKLTFDK